MVEVDNFDGHLILYCKGHYKAKNFFEGLKAIWAVRCGYPYEFGKDNHVYQNVADRMYKLIRTCEPDRMPYLMEVIHRELTFQGIGKPEGMTPIQAIVWEYRSILQNMQIRDDNELLIQLPKPMKRVFNRILRGNGRSDDYYKVKEGKFLTK